MTATVPEIRTIPVNAITVLNPRVRNKKIFNELVTSIAHLGLKKPITVSARPDGSSYDLVCGQGRLEAFIALGQTEIPAVVLEESQEDCFVMSLVENLARRHHSPIELMREIGTLRKRGYSIDDIAAKTDFSEEYVKAICHLLDDGEERLLTAIERGVMPTSVAMEIVRAQDSEIQEALAEAYEKKAIPGNQILAIRRIIELRNVKGKGMCGRAGRTPSQPKKRVTADSLVRAYRKETERQKLLVKKAAVTQSRLLFVVNALRRLFADEHFVTLLRAEALLTLPRPLAERLCTTRG
jgi:ParB family transcriptional regulator, chromosome partitioning protein